MRLQKHLAHAGVASRRASEKIIAEGRVTIDGVVVTDPATDVTGQETITVDGRPIGAPAEQVRVVYAVHKPAGVVSTAKDTHGRPTVIDMVEAPGMRLYPVGRLDADTTGLLLLTNDGDLAQVLTHPSHEVRKTYRAKVGNPPVKEATLRRLREGVQLDDGVTLPAEARAVSRDEIELTLREGRKRQVRRMCETVGHPVISLQRVAFGPLRLHGLAPGTARRLTAAEVERLRAAGRRASHAG
ncbi:pseudouridine synthase [Paraconexibacter sp.]|uniref:pseudouridine synthase n=1 Tax=Paraconexibacter sp. TaxID=2949640 RepID=UPI00356391D1